MITTGIFPDSLKIAEIIPIYKKGKPTDLSNYRPISLLPTISKIFELIIHIHLQEYLNRNNLLAEQQYGFRLNHSTEYAAVKLVDYISIKWMTIKFLTQYLLTSLKHLIRYRMTSCYIS